MVEIQLEKCGTEWKESEITGWSTIIKKKIFGLGSYAYQTKRPANNDEFLNGIYFTKQQAKFSALFNIADPASEKQIYKILQRTRMSAQCNTSNFQNVATQPIASNSEILRLPFPQGANLNETEALNFLNKYHPPEGIQEEKVVFMVNKKFADKYPSWQKGADEIIEYANTVLKKNTNVRLRAVYYTTYNLPIDSASSADLFLQNIKNNPEQFLGKDIASILPQGLLFIYAIDPIVANRLSTADSYVKNGKIIRSIAVTGGDEDRSPLRGKFYYQQSLPAAEWEIEYRSDLQTTLHEMGHSLGLAMPEWYKLAFNDLTVAPPLLDLRLYNLNETARSDPMAGGGASEYKFSDLNAYIINQGFSRYLTMPQIFSLLTRKVVLRVKDKNGNPVSNTTVDVYGIDQRYDIVNNSDRRFFVLRETVLTNNNGYATIKAPLGQTFLGEADAGARSDGGIYYAEIIKVSKNGKHGGGYVDSLMLLKRRLLEKSDTYYMDIIMDF